MSDLEQWDEYDNDEEIEVEAIGIEVSEQPIELYKVFKIANLVGGGGEAKHIIAEGYVAVNGEIETRKRRKMYDGDLIEFNQEYYVVLCEAPVTEPVTLEEKQAAKELARQEKARQEKVAKQKARGQKSAKAANGSAKNAASKKPSKAQSATSSGSKAKANNKASNQPKKGERDSQSGRRSINFF